MSIPHSPTIYLLLLLLTIPFSLSNPVALPANNLQNLRANPLTFRQIIAQAVHMIQEANPSAQLNRIELTSVHGPIHNPLQLIDIRLFFANPSPTPGEQAILLASRPRALAWGQWEQPHFLPDPRPRTELGLGNILTTDIMQVIRKMEVAGFRNRFRAVDVVREEGMQEVFWQVKLSPRGSGWVLVGDQSGEVEFEDEPDEPDGGVATA